VKLGITNKIGVRLNDALFEIPAKVRDDVEIVEGERIAK